MDRIIANGRTYIRLDSCSYGEFIGAGAIVGMANLRSLMKTVKNWNEVNSEYLQRDSDDKGLEYPDSTIEVYLEGADLLIVKYQFGDAAEAYLAEDYHSYDEIVGALESYPLLDEEEYSQAENELKAEFMEMNRGDIERQLTREFESHAERAIYGLVDISGEQAEERIESLMAKFEEMLEEMSDDGFIALIDVVCMNGHAEWTESGGGVWFDVSEHRGKLYEKLEFGSMLIAAELGVSMN